jgi:TetR/AcrR family transcriptional regulator, tetracycline repressor protein
MARRSQDQPSGLSHERILEVALELAAHEGIEALSMRRLAQELDVWPMSVYRYFQDKDALLDAMAADLIEQLPELDAEAPWRERMHALLEAAARRLAESPGLAARLPRAFLGERALRLPEAGVAILLDAGFEPSDAASAWRALWSYTFGFATFGVGEPRTVRAAVAGLDEDHYPALAGAGDAFADALGSDDELAAGLDRLLDGLACSAGLSRA